MSNLSFQRVLVVDDEPNVRLMVRTALTSVGYQVIEATNGREALNILETDPPDVMVLDLSMPQLDGMGVLHQLAKVPPERKPHVIVLTAFGSISKAVEAMQAGALDFLEKPVSLEDLRESVSTALATPKPAAAPKEDLLAGGYAGVLDKVRKSLRLGKHTDAESLLMKAADLAVKDAAYFNLLGVIYECQRNTRQARKFYGKSISANHRYEPAQTNMRRLYELQQFGRTREAVALGDEKDILYARLQQPV